MPQIITTLIKVGILVLIIYFCVRNSDLAQKKGQSAVKYVLLTILFASVLPRIIYIAVFIGLLLAGVKIDLDSVGAELIIYIIQLIMTLGGALFSESLVDRSENLALKEKLTQQERTRRKIEEAEKEAERKALEREKEKSEPEEVSEEDEFAVSAALNALDEE